MICNLELACESYTMHVPALKTNFAKVRLRSNRSANERDKLPHSADRSDRE